MRRLVHRKNFFSTCCCIFTLVSLAKVVLEYFLLGEFGHYPYNLTMILFFSVITTLILSQHYRIFSLPLVFAVLVQYLLVISAVMLLTWLSSFFAEVAPGGYRDMFTSMSIIYLCISVVYYILFFWEVKRHNRVLQKLLQSRKQDQ